jgi:hypothetical protein
VRAVAHGHVSLKTPAFQASPRPLSTESIWRHNFLAIWMRSTAWMRSPRNSHAWNARPARRLFKPAAHRFGDARGHVARAAQMGAPSEAIERHLLTIDQACGVELDAVLAARRRIAAASGRLSSISPRRTLSIDGRFPLMKTLRRFRWRGSAFSSACCGANLCLNRIRILLGSGIDVRLRTCPAM